MIAKVRLHWVDDVDPNPIVQVHSTHTNCNLYEVTLMEGQVT